MHKPSAIFSTYIMPSINAKYDRYKVIKQGYEELESIFKVQWEKMSQFLANSRIQQELRKVVSDSFVSLKRRIDKNYLPYSEVIKTCNELEKMRIIYDFSNGVKYEAGDPETALKAISICLPDPDLPNSEEKHWRFIQEFKEDLRELCQTQRIELLNKNIIAKGEEMRAHLGVLDKILDGHVPERPKKQIVMKAKGTNKL